MFPHFQVYIQNEFAMHHKHNKSLAKAVGHGITNMVTHNKVDAQLQADVTVYAIQEVANAMQQQQDKKFEQIMQLFQMMLQMQGNYNKMQDNNNNGNNNGNAPTDQKPPHPKCKHSNCRHKKDESECWELEANKDKHPKGYKTKAEKVKQDS